MSKKTIAIIGGNQEQTFRKLGKRLGCNILFHTGISRKSSPRNEFRPLVKKADCVVVLLGACGHGTMDAVKELCKEHNTLVDYHQGRGGTGALTLGLELIESAQTGTKAVA